jgi:hypothetical protein
VNALSWQILEIWNLGCYTQPLRLSNKSLVGYLFVHHYFYPLSTTLPCLSHLFFRWPTQGAATPPATAASPDPGASFGDANSNVPNHANAYIDKILNQFNMQDSKKGFLPMSHGITLSKKQCPSEPDEQERMRAISYALAIGSIMYAMLCTRPDVSYALSAMSKYQSNYGDAHWTIVKNMLKYLRRIKEAFLVFGGEEELVVKDYSDASFQTDANDSKL